MTKIEELEGRLGANWPNIRRARDAALARKAALDSALARVVPVDSTITVFGSVAREELTGGSDLDWTLLIDGQANPQHFDAALDVERILDDELGIKPPGREGTFSGLAFSHDIVHRIGGGDDTNRNTTQRVLLLLESAPIGDPSAYDRVIRSVLKRYVTEDYGWMHRSVTVPRFLQNDIVRYWRTVAVDFAYKRRQRNSAGWALRTVKLRLSRKLTYASGLLACFWPALPIDDEWYAPDAESDRSFALVDLLLRLTASTPLERIARAAGSLPGLDNHCVGLFSAYDEFLKLLDDSACREHLESLPPSAAEKDDLYQQARGIGHRFQASLNGIFFDTAESGIPDLTRKYGVF